MRNSSKNVFISQGHAGKKVSIKLERVLNVKLEYSGVGLILQAFFLSWLNTHIIKFVILATFKCTDFLGNHHHHPFPEFFSFLPTEPLCPLSTNLYSLIPQALATTTLLSVSMSLTTLGNSHKSSHIVFVLL